MSAQVWSDGCRDATTLGQPIWQWKHWKGDTGAEAERDKREGAVKAANPRSGAGAGRHEHRVGLGAAVHAPGLRAGGDRRRGGVQKKSRWEAAHGAVEQDGARAGVNVLGVCRKVQMTPQNYYARRQQRRRRQIDGDL